MNIKNNFVILAILLMLIVTSISANAINISSSKKNQTLIETNDDIVYVYAGNMLIDCNDDHNECDIDCPESPHRDINPHSSETAKIQFHVDWKIINQNTLKNEKWYFKLILKEGIGPDSPVICTSDIEIDDTYGGIGGPDDSDGEFYTDIVELSRNNFDKHAILGKPETLNYRAELYCEYYRGDLFSDPSLRDDMLLWTVTRIDLANEGPSIPTLTSDDIINGGTGDIDKTYNFKASGSVDPDGDPFTYLFDFHDGTVIENVDGIASHKWEEQGNKKVSVMALDRFSGGSWAAEMTFTLPRFKTVFPSLLERFLEFNRLSKL